MTPQYVVSAFRRTSIRRAVAASMVAAIAVAATPSAHAQSRNFLWKASRGQSVVYLVGSVHLLSRDYYPLSPALETAFKDTDLLVEELHLGQMAQVESQMTILMRGMLPSGQTLDKVVSPATFALVSARVKALGLPIEPLMRFKPWALALTLLGLEWQAAGFDAALGLDRHFYDQAVAAGKEVQGLETVEFQISRFDELPMEEQDRMLASTLRELETEKAAVTTLANAWKAGDAPTVERIVLQELRKEPKMYDRLLVERNKDWLPKIEALFARKGRAFVVVGAAHLVGPDGLLAMLKAKGYAIEQL
jgi:uncharacterized protein YbaP (TraB family)